MSVALNSRPARVTTAARSWLATSLLCASATLVACSADGSPTSPRRLVPRNFSASINDITSTPIIWSQYFTIGGHAHIDGETSDADDFVVPAAQTWRISEVVLVGHGLEPFVNEQQVLLPVTITIRANASGLPGDAIHSETLAPVASEVSSLSSSEKNYLFRFAAPVTLDAGTYWLAITVPPYPGLSVAQFTWIATTTVTGSEGALLFDNSVPWFGNGGFDFDFVLYGTNVAVTTLTNDLQATLQGFGLDGGTFTSLNAKLRSLQTAIASGDTAAACSALRDFLNQVNALTGKKLTPAQAAALISTATQLQQALGC